MSDLRINLGHAEYPIHIGSGILDSEIAGFCTSNEYQSVLLVADRLVYENYAFNFSKELEQRMDKKIVFLMDAGKANKTLAHVIKIFGMLEDANFPRDSLVIALGGGVVGDLAGFVASCWYRGTPLVHIPTTVVGMIDSSIGGKTAINFRSSINAIGSYHHPEAIFIDLDFVESLPSREFFSGMAEIIKCAMIADLDFFEFLEKESDAIKARDPIIFEVMRRTIRIKEAHVHGDVQERGKRLLLNFGHTLGHAIEMASQNESEEALRHGEGVALGMISIVQICQKYLNLDTSVLKRLESLLKCYELPTSFSSSSIGWTNSDLIKRCLDLVQKDKKRHKGAVRLVCLNKIGDAFVTPQASEEMLLHGFNSILTA
jgi:3-dehydroquinate synthase